MAVMATVGGFGVWGAALSLVVFAIVLRPRVHTRLARAALLALVLAGGFGQVNVVRAEDFTDEDLILLPCPRWPDMSEWERWLCLTGIYCDCV